VPKKKETSEVRRKYEFIKANHGKRSVRMMCRLLDVAPSGYYAWLKHPKSIRAKEDARLLRLIRASFKASQGVYGAPRVFLDLREAGETCSKHRVARLMRENNMRAVAGYRTRRYIAGRPAELIPNLVKRNFSISQPDRVWVTDITYVRTWEGWLYVAIVLDLFSRKVIGWAARQTIHRDLVLDAILMAVRQRSPNRTIVHSDQGSQYGSDDWRRFCRSNKLEPSMSRRGNCWDNAVAESFFSSLKKERIKKKIYKNRQLAIQDISDYIDSFYNRTRRHQHLGGVSPDEFEAAAKPPKTGVH
jgi:putative transposase